MMTIVGGHGRFRYQYDPDMLLPPPAASIINCHGFALDEAENIYLTYESNKSSDRNCLIRWSPDGRGEGKFVAEESGALCLGTPHGLTIAMEDNEYLYHANNDQRLTKTFLNGTIVWQVAIIMSIHRYNAMHNIIYI